MDVSEIEGIATVVLAGNAKIKRQLRRRRRRGVFFRISHPSLWNVDKKKLEASLASRINRDDYIVGENKTLLYLHPDLISQQNINFLKRVLYFAGKTGDRIYKRNKKDLLEYLSRKGEAPISKVLLGVQKCRYLDKDRTVIIGPRRQIQRELDRSEISGFHVEDQRESIGENILIGKKVLKDLGYKGKYMLVIGGDLPLLTGMNLSLFLERAFERPGDPDIRFGMGTRQELKVFIERNDLTSMGAVGPNHPRSGNLNKFGIPIKDDLGIFGERDSRKHLMMGNMFITRFDRVNRKFINRFYSLRKMGANPLTYPYLIYKFGRPLIRAMRWNMAITEAEKCFLRATGVDLKVAPVSADLTLDLDSYSDLRRLSALYFHRLRTTNDLETDLKDYLKMKRAERRSARRSQGGKI